MLLALLLALLTAGFSAELVTQYPKAGGTAVFAQPAYGKLVVSFQVACLNVRGISESMKSNIVMTLIEVGGLLIAIVAGAMPWPNGTGDASRVTQFPSSVAPATATLGAAIIAY